MLISVQIRNGEFHAANLTNLYVYKKTLAERKGSFDVMEALPVSIVCPKTGVMKPKWALFVIGHAGF